VLNVQNLTSDIEANLGQEDADIEEIGSDTVTQLQNIIEEAKSGIKLVQGGGRDDSFSEDSE
jgi:UDP-N-acetylglucosamine 2-epimerase